MIFDVMREIHKVNITGPIKIGDVIVHNIASSGSDLVATSES